MSERDSSICWRPLLHAGNMGSGFHIQYHIEQHQIWLPNENNKKFKKHQYLLKISINHFQLATSNIWENNIWHKSEWGSKMHLINYHQNQGGKKAELLSKGSQVAAQQAMRGSGLDALKSLLSKPIAWQKWENSCHSAVHGVLWLGRLQRQSRPVIAEVLKSKSMWAS